jgi:preprotein translocase subunit SecD
MKRALYWRLSMIVVLALVAGLIVWPNQTGVRFLDQYSLHEGLDLKGGTHFVYALKLDGVAHDQVEAAVESARAVIANRVDQLGVSEAIVQPSRAGDTRTLIVELPGVTDLEQAKQLIGKTANLEFWEPSTDPVDQTEAGTLPGFKRTTLSGKHLKSAAVEFDQQTNEPQIKLLFNADGATLFGEITGRNVGQPVAIVLDGQPITVPTVQAEISSGEAQITGDFTLQQAKTLAIQLNAGALPVPVELVEQRTVGATLGTESVTSSVLAGLIGLGLVMVFMILSYGWLGVIASIALTLYTVFTAALIESIPVTLSLAGIAGVILSVGMAVDANILIFERMKEERRAGRPMGRAIDEGFHRAWQSIRDSNVSSLLTASILYFTTTGLVRGFALTLALGIVVSMFTAITVTRTLMKLTLRERMVR